MSITNIIVLLIIFKLLGMVTCNWIPLIVAGVLIDYLIEERKYK